MVMKVKRSKKLSNSEMVGIMKRGKQKGFSDFRISQDIDFANRDKSGKISIGEVKRTNKEKGRFFFSKDTMKFFNSRVETKGDLQKGKYFITSEKFDENTPRKYSVRKFDRKSGEIETVGEFGQFRSKQEASGYIKSNLK